MKKVTVETDKGPRELEIKLKAKHIDREWDALESIYKDGKEDVTALRAFFKVVDEIACEATGLKPEELQNLDIDEKEKITGYIQSKVTHQIDFLRPSPSAGP